MEGGGGGAHCAGPAQQHSPAQHGMAHSQPQHSPGHGPSGLAAALHVPPQLEELASANASTVAPAIAPWNLCAEETIYGRLSCSPKLCAAGVGALREVHSPVGSPGSSGTRVRRLSSPLMPPELLLPPPPAAHANADAAQAQAAPADGCAGLPVSDGGLAPSAAEGGEAGPVGAKRPREHSGEIVLPIPDGALGRDESAQPAT